MVYGKLSFSFKVSRKPLLIDVIYNKIAKNFCLSIIKAVSLQQISNKQD